MQNFELNNIRQISTLCTIFLNCTGFSFVSSSTIGKLSKRETSMRMSKERSGEAGSVKQTSTGLSGPSSLLTTSASIVQLTIRGAHRFVSESELAISYFSCVRLTYFRVKPTFQSWLRAIEWNSSNIICTYVCMCTWVAYFRILLCSNFLYGSF